MCTRCSAWHCVSWRHIWRVYNIQLHQQRCVYTISNQNSISFITSSINVCFPNLTIYFSLFAAIRFFTHSVTKSKISVRWIKNWSPLRSAYIDLYIINHYCIISTKLQPPHQPPPPHLPVYFDDKRPKPRLSRLSQKSPQIFLRSTIPPSFARDFR